MALMSKKIMMQYTNELQLSNILDLVEGKGTLVEKEDELDDDET